LNGIAHRKYSDDKRGMNRHAYEYRSSGSGSRSGSLKHISGGCATESIGIELLPQHIADVA
jgi:hypothetical protein